MTRDEDLKERVLALGDPVLIEAIEELVDFRRRIERYDLATMATAYMHVQSATSLEDAQRAMTVLMKEALEDSE